MIQVFLILISCIGASYPQNTTDNEEWNGIVNAPATFNKGRPGQGGHGGHGGGHGGGRPHGGGWNTPDICRFHLPGKLGIGIFPQEFSARVKFICQSLSFLFLS